MTHLSRRALLATGAALVVHFSLDAPARADGPGLPGALADLPQLGGWVRIDASGTITVFTGKAELGQGIRTALTQIAAEQLDVAPSDIHLVTADTARTANEGYTSGSLSMKNSGTAVLHATAEMRALLLQAAASKLGVAVGGLKTEGGFVVAPDGRRLSYGELAQSVPADVKATGQVAVKDPATHRIMGRKLARLDIPAKVTGGAAFVHDMRLPGMLHARLVRPPVYGATLISADIDAVAKMPGVAKVVRDGSYLAVIAGRQWQAMAGDPGDAGACRQLQMVGRAQAARAGRDLRSAAWSARAGHGYSGSQRADSGRCEAAERAISQALQAARLDRPVLCGGLDAG